MTELVIKLPDELAIQRLLEDAMRREAGRRLLQVAERLHAAGVPPMSEDEVVAEVKAERGERRVL